MNDWRQELRGNPRLQAGLVLVAALLWLFGLLELDDRLTAAQRDRQRLGAELERLRGVAGEQQWPALRDQASQRLADMRSLAWREESEGRMQALMQDWLREQLAKVGAQPRELVVTILPASALSGVDEARKAELPAEMRIARARLSFDFQPETLHRFLATLPASRQWIWVSRLVVDNGGRRAVEVELEALFILGARTAG